MEAEFALPKLTPKPAKPDPVKLLNEKLAEVEREKSELVAAPPSHARNWWPMASVSLGGLVLISLVAVWIQRRSH